MRKGDVGHYVTMARLKKRVAALEKENAELKAKVEQLERQLGLVKRGQHGLGRYMRHEP